mmetsp:Transcript_21009/g.23851  ORF Transcript_21009/g.23851 Transcript_21009/m.23851 type:complete len:450 (+) Transcript_21009:111-1460(+)
MQEDYKRTNDKRYLNCCCCKPYPLVDLTPVFQQNETVENHVKSRLKQNVKNACLNYGCFHVSIDSQVVSKRGMKSLASLSDRQHVKQVIESLFEEDFVKAREDENDEASIVETSFTLRVGGNQCENLSAIFRGRSTESGSEQNDTGQGEPKQSWEFFRCRSSSTSTTTADEDARNTNASRLEILKIFSDALHEVVIGLCSYMALNLPPNKFASTFRNEVGQLPRSKDLLRVFRYDALSTPAEQMSNLGSSSHTDWGSMTVVWQDSKGGLQIYCHEHECWNDVEVPNSTEETENIHLFIHVGDFLSLSMNMHKKSTEGTSKFEWPSPTHRVLCPLRINDCDDEIENSRCSLVYFVYPPNGVSLFDAMESLDILHSNDVNQVKNDLELPHILESFPCSRYMLLKDQSIQIQDLENICLHDKASANVLKKILNLPFDEVIEDKWNQVQRQKT